MFKKNISIMISAAVILSLLLFTACSHDTEYRSSASSEEKKLYSDHHDKDGDDLHYLRSSADDIGMDEAIDIAVSKVPGASSSDVTEIERDYDNGRIEYEGELWYNGYEYEFEIDAATGNILKWEIDN